MISATECRACSEACLLLGSVSDIDNAHLRSCKLETRAWFSVIRTNGAVPAANYPLTSWCAIYCVAAPQVPDIRPDGGVLRLYESRLGTTFIGSRTERSPIWFVAT